MRSRVPTPRSLPALLAVLTMFAAACGLAGCSAAPDTAGSAAQRFLDRFEARDTDAAAELTDQPDTAKTALDAAWSGLQAQSLKATVGAVRANGDTATVGYTYEWHLPKDRIWTYSGDLQMGRKGGRWGLRWTSTDLHPNLGATQTMALRVSDPPRAPVLGRDGVPVLVPGTAVQVLLDARNAGNLPSTATTLAGALSRFDPTLTPQALAESASAHQGAYAVITLTPDDYQQVKPIIYDLPGVRFSEQATMVPASPAFANDTVEEIEKVVVDDVDGKAGWRVVTVDPNGVDVDVLTDTAAQPAPAISVSLDGQVQEAAQQAVDAVGGHEAVLVAIQPSTGQILAVAQNGLADKQGPIALQGLFPPGSTFKIITAGAAIDAGLAGPNTALGCPGTVTIGTRTIPNYDEFSLGTVPMSTAFARSCNTTFAKLASQMKPDALTRAAARYGIGVNYTVHGITTDTGKIPPAADLVQRTEDGFGQGKDLVSPFGMALAAATVAHGSTPVPQLINGVPTTVTGGPGAPISPAMVDGLRPMMREVVTSGTGAAIAGEGEVYGKTGEAEIDGGSHAWFAGYRGDLAFATLIVAGGSSDNAVGVTKAMFDALPDGYLG
ncbi:penicillin-binding transpeptidase domain-containing protein [Speluncibacter jeojiensis]|uniref:Penicillin-binding transpeptidase domain-containing protein n=1 Tax=Speluncibacter jeojiensis TaxID=2710754 RepID=A0A9X4RGF3_9ACTN|nr:penicillin-binding transpeptidase domain-containing protein [Corynebacteriales bacterium D3-21]